MILTVGFEKHISTLYQGKTANLWGSLIFTELAAMILISADLLVDFTFGWDAQTKPIQNRFARSVGFNQGSQWSRRSVQQPWTVQNEAIQVVYSPSSPLDRLTLF